MAEYLTLIIPAYNEASCILKTLKSIDAQIFPEEFSLKVLIIPNGCTDETEKVSLEFVNSAKNKNIQWKVVSLVEGSKIKALNKGLELCETDVVAYMDADAWFNTDGIYSLYSSLVGDEKLRLLGPFAYADFSSFSKDCYLYQVQKAIELYKVEHKLSPPIGRFIIFYRKDVEEFPLNVASDDTWISLHVCQKYAVDSIKVMLDIPVFYNPAKNWHDYIKQESRFIVGTKKLWERFPEMEEIDKKRIAKIQETTPTKEEVIPIMVKRLEENNLPLSLVDDVQNVIYKIIKENVQLSMNTLVTKDGRWDPIESTKL